MNSAKTLAVITAEKLCKEDWLDSLQSGFAKG
jgi:hypothetical protein